MVNNLKEQIEVLQKRLAVLEKKRLIAGANLRITEVTEDMTLIEQVRSDENSESFSGTTDEAGSIFETPSAADLTVGGGLVLRDNGLQRVIEIDPAFLNATAPEEYTAKTTDFPFRIRPDDTQPDDSNSRRFLLCAGGDEAEGMPEALVYAGTATPLHIQKQVFTVERDSCAFLRITLNPGPSAVSPGTPDAEFAVEDSFPDPDTTQYIVPIAKILFRKGNVQIQQMQFGNVYIAGRII